MNAFFQSLGRTLLAGLALLALVFLSARSDLLDLHALSWWTFVMRWLHVAAAILWLGLLGYFNFVQIPAMPRIPDAQKPAIIQIIAPAALFWFRWAALATVFLGLGLASMTHALLPALRLQAPYTAIGIGMWLGLLMAFNVWFILWPLQKKVLGLVPAESLARAQAARTSLLVSRINLMLSVPMLYCMVAQSHGGL